MNASQQLGILLHGFDPTPLDVWRSFSGTTPLQGTGTYTSHGVMVDGRWLSSQSFCQVMPALKNVSSHKSEGGGENTGKSGWQRKGSRFCRKDSLKTTVQSKRIYKNIVFIKVWVPDLCVHNQPYHISVFGSADLSHQGVILPTCRMIRANKLWIRNLKQSTFHKNVTGFFDFVIHFLHPNPPNATQTT